MSRAFRVVTGVDDTATVEGARQDSREESAVVEKTFEWVLMRRVAVVTARQATSFASGRPSTWPCLFLKPLPNNRSQTRWSLRARASPTLWSAAKSKYP